ncbi:MAG: hypothetical protein ACYTXT_35380 [Nostoc sp.]|nr:hypothetical protein [Nostoc sp. XA013]
MSDLSVFVFESQQVRFVGTPEKPEWVAADIVALLVSPSFPRVITPTIWAKFLLHGRIINQL